MAVSGITVLKNNVPWGPFTREQVEDGLARGDFTVKYLAHATGLKEWLPLGEVIDYVDRSAGPRLSPLPPVPLGRDLPPMPLVPPVPESAAPKVEQTTRMTSPPPSRPPSLPTSLPGTAMKPASAPSLVEKNVPKPEGRPVMMLIPASFIPRVMAFLIDGAILFVPLGILYILGALSIVIPGWWDHLSQQATIEQWEWLDQTIQRLFWLVLIGFGWFYGAGLECSPSQATVGKQWMGIKVTDAHGARLDFLRATGRYAAKYLSALPCFLGFIMALFSSRGMALHDRLADTRVVRR